MALGGLVGAAIAAYDYLTPATGLDGAGGVVLVLISCLLMLFAALGLMALTSGGIAGLLSFLILLDIIGTATCGYFLESPVLLAAMALALVGWLMRVLGNAADNSIAVT
jgi:hypothetical protein